MAKKTTLTIRIEPELKESASALFDEVGIDINTATIIFYKQALRCLGFPFKIKIDPSNEETLEAIKEVEEMKKNLFQHKEYNNVDEMMKDLLI